MHYPQVNKEYCPIKESKNEHKLFNISSNRQNSVSHSQLKKMTHQCWIFCIKFHSAK